MFVLALLPASISPVARWGRIGSGIGSALRSIGCFLVLLYHCVFVVFFLGGGETDSLASDYPTAFTMT